MSTTALQSGNQQGGARPQTPPGRPPADSCFRELRHSVDALRRVTALVFPSGEVVETDSWLASHTGPTPTTLVLDESGILFAVEESK